MKLFEEIAGNGTGNQFPQKAGKEKSTLRAFASRANNRKPPGNSLHYK